jgi:outer membrane protein assembly factor BamA
VQIEKFLATKGYLNAKVKSDLKIENKKAEILFTADQGSVFKVKEITYMPFQIGHTINVGRKKKRSTKNKIRNTLLKYNIKVKEALELYEIKTKK